MKVILQGTRGSYPTSNKDTEHFGGSTSCVELVNDNHRIILDAGTGILNIDIANYKDMPRIDIVLTHLHMDHIQGLGFFKLLFDPSKEIHIWGPAGNSQTLFHRLCRFISPPIFPVSLYDYPSDIHIHEITNSTFDIQDFKLHSSFVCHPGPTVGYRIECNSSTLTYIPDHEPILGLTELYKDSDWLTGYDLAKDTDLLIHDAQYDSEGYKNCVGWGHCSMHHASEFAKKTNAKKLVMFHHDPAHTDDHKNKMFDHFKSNNDYDFDMELAVQGKVYEL